MDDKLPFFCYNKRTLSFFPLKQNFAMEPLDFKKKPLRGATANRTPWSFLTLSKLPLPRSHVLLAGFLSLGLAVVASLPSEQAQASRQSIDLPIPELTEAPIEQVLQENTWQSADMKPDTVVRTEVVKPGDNLSVIFARAGLTDKHMIELVNSSKEARALAQIYPGHKFIFEIDSDNNLIALRRKIDALTSEHFLRVDGRFAYQIDSKTPDIKVAVRSGVIDSSLYKTGLNAGLNDQLIMELAEIFGWDIDFALDIRKGDSFRILYEEKFLDGEHLGTGNILAAEFVNQNTSFQAVRYVDEEGKPQYYTPSGKAMRKAFLRAPLDFRRISSNFNPRRLHPVTKTVRPHRGTDYAANRGTPVWASGDGRVTASGYTSANGHYIVIQHGNNIQTKYLHLHQRKVKTGDRVRQKQVIGTVGSTGLSTAPHLHYEFLLNGVHRNPRTIVQKLPKAKSIPDSEMARFLSQTQPIVAQLSQTTRMAALESQQ